ncbi:site-specific DNA-methyltransferase, partial [bacterium]|nr:site-specific DNA-methyltransferase [bacterium]
KIINADVYAGLFSLENNSVDVAITSPPYWSQRDYGFEGQIGNEKTYTEFIGKLVKIFSLLRQKLTDKGVFFLNIGDKYLAKYGNSPLGFIPYKLAHFMVKDGWKLNEILVWYKPNHMPSSIKNRFTNSYEPIFVFSKNPKNYFSEKEQTTNILSVNLQPTPYKHVAVYPEKLVCNLLEMVSLPEKAVVLDPFGGSGTTAKVVKENFFTENFSAVLVESNPDYVEIIKKRCSLTDKNVWKLPFLPYYFENVSEKINPENIKNIENFKFAPNGFVKIVENKKDFCDLLALFGSSKIKKQLDKNAVCFIGTKDFDLELIYKTSLLNQNNWIIRNLLVVQENKKWFPVFMIVDDNKITKYKFNYKNLDLKHKNKTNQKFDKINFSGLKVENNLTKNKLCGFVVKILETYSDGLPKYVVVKWENETFTKEFVINSQEEVNKNLEIYLNGKTSVSEKQNLTHLIKKIDFNQTSQILPQKNEPIYNGKFKDEKKVNRGASPGARASVEEIYFSLQRLYNVEQNLVADYLNTKRMKKNLSKLELTKLFPENYKHTVGHWLRKDFGGSIPLPQDWETLSELLELEKDFSNYVCKSALKLQTVQNGNCKMPEDFISVDFLEKIECLIKP